MDNIFIISARRSGTHLLTDTIVNNFNYKRIDNNIDYDFLSNENAQRFIDEMSSGKKLAWSHYHNFDNFFDKDLIPEYIESLKLIFKNSKIIFIYRDIRDVITSHYYRPYIQSEYKSFLEYYNNHDMRDFVGITNYDGESTDIIEVLMQQHKNWFSVYFAKEILGLDMHIVSYEELINDYTKTINIISDFLQETPSSNVKDVRLKSNNDRKNDIIYTDHHFRHGRTGDWKEVFCEQWGEVIDNRYRLEIKNHVNAYQYNPKLHEFHSPETKFFQINSRDWEHINNVVSAELIQYENKFSDFNIDFLIKNRYSLSRRKSDDVRYQHKVFYFDDYVLKYVVPCKAVLNKKTFDYVIPIASKINLLTIFKTYDILYELDIVPKLYYAGIYNGFLVIVQEKIDESKLVYRKYAKLNWDWMVTNEIFPHIIENFMKAVEKNILITDFISPFNSVIVNGKLKCVDLDGIYIFNDIDELKKSEKYLNQVNLFKDIDRIWEQRFGKSLLKNIVFN